MIDLSNVTAIALGSDDVLQIQDAIGTVLWQKAQPALPDYFYAEDISGSDNTLTIWSSEGMSIGDTVYASTDCENWTAMTTNQQNQLTATIPANGKLYVKATLTQFGWGDVSCSINASGNYNVGGNIMSLVYGDNFENTTLDPMTGFTPPKFMYSTTLASAQNLELPSNVIDWCYSDMFSGCSSLTAAPVLNAATLAEGCYMSMFSYCTLLNSVISYAQDISAMDCTANWLDGVAATGDFYNLGGATYTSGDPSGIPSGWTEHTSL